MARAMPKSITFTWPVCVTMMFAGLMSRWTTPARCEYSRAVRMPSVMRTASAGATGPSEMMSESGRPSTCSITMYGTWTSAPEVSVTVSSPASYTRTIVGWAIRAADWASCGSGSGTRVVGEARLQQLDGHLAPEPGVVAEVHGGHAATTDDVTDLVAVGEERDPRCHTFWHVLLRLFVRPSVRQDDLVGRW